MNGFVLSFVYFAIIFFIHANGQTFATNAKINSGELKCLGEYEIFQLNLFAIKQFCA